MVIATGIGPVAAALCTLELLICGRWIQEIIYVGTSGWSPQQGGVVSVQPWKQAGIDQSSSGCAAANPRTTPNRVGDLCVSPLAVNWVCKKADFLQQCSNAHTLCTMPEETSGPSASALYGQCEFTSHSPGQQGLASELQAAAQAAIDGGAMPTRDAATASWETAYWQGMTNGTGVAYVYDAAAAPTLYKEKQCAEVDGCALVSDCWCSTCMCTVNRQFFYTGPPFEMKARAYVAETINRAYGNDTVDLNKVGTCVCMCRWTPSIVRRQGDCCVCHGSHRPGCRHGALQHP